MPSNKQSSTNTKRSECEKDNNNKRKIHLQNMAIKTRNDRGRVRNSKKIFTRKPRWRHSLQKRKNKGSGLTATLK